VAILTQYTQNVFSRGQYYQLAAFMSCYGILK